MFADSGIENSLGISIDTRDEREQTEQARVLPADALQLTCACGCALLYPVSLRKYDSADPAGAYIHRADPR